MTLVPPPTPEEIAQATRELKLTQGFPWGVLATNLGAVGGAHLLGYLTAGMLSHAAGKTPLAKWLSNQPLEKRQRLLQAAFTGSGVGTGLLLTGQQIAAQARLHDKVEQQHAEQEARIMQRIREIRTRPLNKVASVSRAYTRALQMCNHE